MLVIRKAVVALGSMLGLLATFIASPAWAVNPVCTQWAVSDQLELVQTNGAATFKLRQDGPNLSGDGSSAYSKPDDSFGCGLAFCGEDAVFIKGPAVGTINGNAFELTVYWSDNSVGVYTGQIGPQGLLIGSTFDRAHPQTTAQFHSRSVLACASKAQAQTDRPEAPEKPALHLGRVPDASTSTPSMSLCDAARSARARNSPAAAALERQCAATKPAPIELGRVGRGGTVNDSRSLCQAAADARARNSPAAPGLERQCDALRVSSPEPPNGEEAPPHE